MKGSGWSRRARAGGAIVPLLPRGVGAPRPYCTMTQAPPSTKARLAPLPSRPVARRQYLIEGRDEGTGGDPVGDLVGVLVVRAVHDQDPPVQAAIGRQEVEGTGPSGIGHGARDRGMDLGEG